MTARRKLNLLKIMNNRMLTQKEPVPDSVHPRPFIRYASTRPPVFVKPNTSRFVESVTYQGPKLWSELLSHVKNMNDITTFDKELRKLIKEKFPNSGVV